jgi:hypothetical protein
MSDSHAKSLPTQWRTRAAMLREHGARDAATLLEKVASELEATLNNAPDIALSVREVAQRTGYTRDHVRYLIKTRKLINVGLPGGALRVMASQLKAKPDNAPGPKRETRRGGRARPRPAPDPTQGD